MTEPEFEPTLSHLGGHTLLLITDDRTPGETVLELGSRVGCALGDSGRLWEFFQSSPDKGPRSAFPAFVSPACKGLCLPLHLPSTTHFYLFEVVSLCSPGWS
jgi:hypothetical protein